MSVVRVFQPTLGSHQQAGERDSDTTGLSRESDPSFSWAIIKWDNNSCADLFMPDPPFVSTERTQMCAHVKHPISICRKRLSFTAGGMVTKILHTLG